MFAPLVVAACYAIAAAMPATRAPHLTNGNGYLGKTAESGFENRSCLLLRFTSPCRRW